MVPLSENKLWILWNIHKNNHIFFPEDLHKFHKQFLRFQTWSTCGSLQCIYKWWCLCKYLNIYCHSSYLESRYYNLGNFIYLWNGHSGHFVFLNEMHTIADFFWLAHIMRKVFFLSLKSTPKSYFCKISQFDKWKSKFKVHSLSCWVLNVDGIVWKFTLWV